MVLPNDGSPNVNEAKLYVNGVEESYTTSGEPINTSITKDVVIGASAFAATANRES